MKTWIDLVRSIAWLWLVLFALGTFLLVVFFPLILPAALFLRWVWQ